MQLPLCQAPLWRTGNRHDYKRIFTPLHCFFREGSRRLACIVRPRYSISDAPAGIISIKMAIYAATESVGPVYLSFRRDPLPDPCMDDFPLESGKLVTIRDGHDVTIPVMRDPVIQALMAVE